MRKTSPTTQILASLHVCFELKDLLLYSMHQAVRPSFNHAVYIKQAAYKSQRSGRTCN